MSVQIYNFFLLKHFFFGKIVFLSTVVVIAISSTDAGVFLPCLLFGVLWNVDFFNMLLFLFHSHLISTLAVTNIESSHVMLFLLSGEILFFNSVTPVRRVVLAETYWYHSHEDILTIYLRN